MQTNVHWTAAQISEMTLDDVLPLLNYWRRHPPLCDLVAAFVGFKPPPDELEKPRQMTIEEVKLLYPDGILRG